MKKTLSVFGPSLAALAFILCAPEAGAQTKFFTGPYGPGGSYNLYEVVTTAATWDAADTASLAREAQATGVSGVAGVTTTGHLVQISSEDENTFVALAAALAPNSGNSNVWLGLNDVAAEQGSNRTGWVWSGTGDTLDAGEFGGWFTGEPNNSGDEDAVEMRTDGRWNDNKINAATTRKYVIEYEIGSATPISGAREVPVLYTARFGAGNKWNLYKVVATSDSWPNAHNRAISETAESTGLASMAGNTTTGHLISCGDSIEAGFAYSATAWGGFGTINTWIGATDDPAYGGTESNGSPTAGWVWAGDPSTPFSYQSFARRPLLNAAEPNNAGGNEHYAEIRNDSQWNDGVAAGPRRFIIEWEILADDPIPGASMGVPFLGATPDLGPLTAGQWKVRTIRNSDAPAGTAQFTINGLPIAAQVATTPPAGVATNDSTHPVINFGDVSGTAGRSTNGLFWPDTVWPTDTNNTDDNHLVMLAQTVVPIPAAGLYTLSIHGDDGFHIRVKPPAGESALVVKTTGLGRVDAGDPSAAMYPLTIGDSNTRVVYEVSAPGDYVVEYLQFEATSSSFAELSFAVGSAEYDWDADFTLLGGPVGGTAIMSTFNGLGTPAGTGIQWGVRTYTALGGNAVDQVDALTRMATAPSTDTVLPVINMFDPDNPHNSLFTNDDSFPANTTADDNTYGITAKGKLEIPAPGLYTVGIACDDNFGLRVTGGRWRGRYAGFSNVVMDANDPSTIFWMTNGALSLRAAIYFDMAGTYDLDLLHYEGTGGSGVEVYVAAGVQQLDTDTTAWTLVGDTAAISPIFPALIPGTMQGTAGFLGLHRVGGTGTQMTSQRVAVAALSNSGVGTHATGLVAKINFIDPDLPGRAGFFGNDTVIPGDNAGVNDDDFALHAHGRMRVDVGGTYTFVVNATDGWAFRIAGQAWNGVNGNAAIDPADGGTIGYNRPSAARDAEFLGRARITLPAGDYDIDFMYFERGSAASVEMFSIAGDFLTLGEYVAGATANNGDASLRSTSYRLVGHQADPAGYRYPGMTPDGWTIKQSRPLTVGAAAPAGWGGTNLTTHDTYLDADPNALTAANLAYVNMNDPGFGGPGPIVNDSPIPQNNQPPLTANVDDNYYVSRFTGMLSIPVDGTYSFGFHGDDGGYIEFLNTGDVRATPTFLRVTGDSSSTTALGNISTSSEGVAGARIDMSEGGGNQRIVGAVFLAAGEWPVRVQWFEGTGGSYRELFCSPSGGDATPFVLLRANGASASPQPDINGLYMVGGAPLSITAFSTNVGAGTYSITFVSVPGQSYILEASSSLVPLSWNEVDDNVMGAPAAQSTTLTHPLSELAPYEMGGQVYLRLRTP